MANYRELAGTTIGQYEVQALTSEVGDIVTTYKGFQPSLKRPVAIQVLNLNFANDEALRRGYIASAEIMAKLEHPNIAPVHDSGTHENLVFIVQRWMHGGVLNQRLEKEPVQFKAKAGGIIKQVASALDFAHSQGIIHGDPSTDNIVFDQSDNAYIGNFHVAGLSTAGNWWFGTPLFTAPEKLQTGQMTEKSDQYAIAAIASGMITGDMQFPAQFSLARQRDADYPVPDDVPQPVLNVLFKGLSEFPEERYPTVVDFARELDNAIQAKPQHLFISYSRRDTDFAVQLRDHLSNNGFTIWIDDAIEHGDQWFNEINEAIESSAAVLVIMTPESEKSEWVHKEILLAKRYQKPIFPLLLSGEEFPILIDIQYADIRDGDMPGTDFHRRLHRVVYGQI